jgi:hypothetical protein
MAEKQDLMTGAVFAETHQLPLAAHTLKEWCFLIGFTTVAVVLGTSPIGFPAPRPISVTWIQFDAEGGNDALPLPEPFFSVDPDPDRQLQLTGAES